ncbi:dTDP-4-dehydrorhamnose 3,5-epimerase family protein [Phaeobacter gallaeciensis]|uniref:dTDP-4-dehydrorhamnose 3,5-epimerase family protein n=1 Tax=Phaeobacter gallaeciensis TaxID=60890 RepID=UPI003CD034DB
MFSVNLPNKNRKSPFIPAGYAHGFLVISEEAVVAYHQTNHFDAASDTGIHFVSFGFQWPVQSPIISEKDAALPGLNEVL